MATEYTVIQALLERLTVITVLGWAVIGFARGWIVPGSAADRLRAETKEWQVRHDKLADIAAAALRKTSGTV